MNANYSRGSRQMQKNVIKRQKFGGCNKVGGIYSGNKLKKKIAKPKMH